MSAKNVVLSTLYDSELLSDDVDRRHNAELRLILKVQLKFVGTTDTHLSDRVLVKDGVTYAKDVDGKLFVLEDWKPLRMAHFRRRFEKEAEDFWSGKFTLVPTDSGFTELDRKRKIFERGVIRPNVLCTLDIQLVDSGAHQVIEVFRLERDHAKGFRSDAKHVKTADLKAIKPTLYRSDYSEDDWRDSAGTYFLGRWRKRVEVRHDAICHEVGHALGQAHIMDLQYNGNVTKSDQNDRDSRAYLGKTVADSVNIMGMGTRLAEVNAVSWLDRIGAHTKSTKSQWRVVLGHVGPQLLRKVTYAAPTQPQLLEPDWGPPKGNPSLD